METRPAPIPASAATGRRYGLDALRLFAIVLVTVQHALSAVGHEPWAALGAASFGQAGVALFCGISGYLAMRSGASPGAWIARRLGRVFPAFWLSMIVAFVLTGVSGRKSFDAAQVVCQMLGVGFFTHGAAIVNTVTWFVSLILLCYVIALAGKLMGRPDFMMCAAALAAAGLVASGYEYVVSRHVLVFCVAGLVGGGALSVRTMLGLGAVAATGAALVQGQLVHAAIACPLLALGLAWGVTLPRVAVRWADLTYEYYLMHGITLSAFTSVLAGRPILGIALGVVGAIVSAPLLRRATDRLGGAIRRTLSRRPGLQLGPS